LKNLTNELKHQPRIRSATRLYSIRGNWENPLQLKWCGWAKDWSWLGAT